MLEFSESILPANEEEFVACVVPTVEMDADREELTFISELCNPEIAVAADEELLDMVVDSADIDELNDAEDA